MSRREKKQNEQFEKMTKGKTMDSRLSQENVGTTSSFHQKSTIVGNETQKQQMERYETMFEKYTTNSLPTRANQLKSSVTVKHHLSKETSILPIELKSSTYGASYQQVTKEIPANFAKDIDADVTKPSNWQADDVVKFQPPAKFNGAFTKPGSPFVRQQSFNGYLGQPPINEIHTRIASPIQHPVVDVRKPSVSIMAQIPVMLIQPVQVITNTIPNVWKTDDYGMDNWSSSGVGTAVNLAQPNIWQKQGIRDLLSIAEVVVEGTHDQQNTAITAINAELPADETPFAIDWGIATHGWGQPVKKLFKKPIKKKINPRPAAKKAAKMVASIISPDQYEYMNDEDLEQQKVKPGAPRISEEKRKLQSVTDKLRYAEKKRVEAESFAASAMAQLAGGSVSQNQPRVAKDSFTPKIPMRNHYAQSISIKEASTERQFESSKRFSGFNAAKYTGLLKNKHLFFSTYCLS